MPDTWVTDCYGRMVTHTTARRRPIVFRSTPSSRSNPRYDSGSMGKRVPERVTTFSGKLLRPADGGDWLFLRLPQDASDEMPARSMVSVEGTMNGVEFAATMEPDSEGGHWLKVDRELIAGAGVGAGSVVEFAIAPAKVEPEPSVPDDLRVALDSAPAALATWHSTTPMARRDWITWLGQGRLAQTRTIRLEKMIDMLSHGKRRVCCFDRAGIVTKAFRCPVAADES